MKVVRYPRAETDRASRLLRGVRRYSLANGRNVSVYGFMVRGRLGLAVDRFGFIANVGQWHLYVERGQETELYRGRPS